MTRRVDSTTWVAHGILAAAAGLGGMASGPLWVETDSRNEMIYGFLAVFSLFYLLVGFTIAGTLAHLFLRLGLATQRLDFATRRALGEPRSALVAQARQHGWKTGLVLIPTAALVGVVIRQLIHDAGAEPGALGEGEFAFTGLITLGMTIVFGVVTTALAHLAATAAITREAPATEAALAATDEDGAARRSTPARRAIRWVLVAVIVAAFVIEGFNRVQPIDPWAIEDLSSRSWVMVVENLALTVALLTALWLTYLAAFSLAQWGIRKAVARLARSVGSGGRAIAADALGRLTGTGRRILAVSVAFSALFAAFAASSGHSMAVAEAQTHATPSVLVTSTDPQEPVRSPGWETRALDPARLAALEADERVDVIPLLQLRGAIGTTETFDADTMVPRPAQQITFAMATDDDLPALDAMRRMGLADGVMLSGSGWGLDQFISEYYEGPTTLEIGRTEKGAYNLWTQLPATFTGASWLEDASAGAPLAAAVVYPAAGYFANDAATAVADHFPAGTAWTSTAGASFSWESGAAVDMWVMGIGLAVIATLLVALAATSVRLRRRDVATMAALGGSSRSLASAPAWEATVLAGSAYVAGTLVGVGFAVVAVNPFLLSAGAPLDPSLIGYHLLADLGAVPWAWLGAGLIALVTITGVVARVLGGAMIGRTPVEELRTAQMEGVR